MKSKPPIDETKDGKFKRIAAMRTNEILNRLRTLGNCANKAVYEYRDEDVEKVFSAIEEQLRLVKTKFRIANGHRKFTL